MTPFGFPVQTTLLLRPRLKLSRLCVKRDLPKRIWAEINSLKELGNGKSSTAEELSSSLKRWALRATGTEKDLLLTRAAARLYVRSLSVFMKRI